jgi:hypothetical protein
MKRVFAAIVLAACLLAAQWPIDAFVRGATTTAPTATTRQGQKIPSEDPVIKNLHSLGLIDGQTNIFRSACPVRDIAATMKTAQPTTAQLAAARANMQHLYDLGIRTVISFQTEVPASAGAKSAAETQDIDLERAAAQLVGITFINDQMGNAGPNSLQTMSDQEVSAWLDAETAKIFDHAKTGGVLFHCAAGQDRTGIVGAYIRIKFEHWPVDQAIDEMRRLGHAWITFSSNGGISSWHEDHLRAIAQTLNAQPAGTTDAKTGVSP